MDEETKVVRGRVTYSKPHFKLVMEPEFEPKQPHAVNHFTLHSGNRTERTGRLWKRFPSAVARSCKSLSSSPFEVNIYLAM